MPTNLIHDGQSSFPGERGNDCDRWSIDRNSTADVLEHITRHILVLPMGDVTWCDWGRPRRVTESLARLGKVFALDRELAEDEALQVQKPLTSEREQQKKWRSKNMTEALNRSNARFGIEIRGLSLHAEAESLQDIHSLLRGHVGRVHVIDRQSKGLLLEGNIEQVRDALESLAKLNADGASVGSVEGA